MFGIHRPVSNRSIQSATILLAFGFALPAAAAMQSDAGVVDVVKPDPPKPEPPQTEGPRTGAPQTGLTQTAAKPGEPTDPKARKTYATALDWEKHKDYNEALDSFLKSNKQDSGHCLDCLRRAYNLSVKLDAHKETVAIARDLLQLAESDADKGNMHFRLAMALQGLGIKDKNNQSFQESSNEFKTALQLDPKLTTARFHWGVTLARLHQDDAAHAQFSAFLEEDTRNPSLHERAERFLDRIDLARAIMAPPFMATTLDGRQISMDSLAGKVVLIDFWATWCGPCREALPHIQKIARKFDGQPLVVLSISLDSDEDKWKTFVAKNQMTWLQVRDGGFNGAVSKRFGVSAIPATFSIDADGVLEDQHVGDADIEGKLKKMVARAAEMGNRKPAPVAAEASPVSEN
jgi:thiol-disulfide isomerase/thioredoxin